MKRPYHFIMATTSWCMLLTTPLPPRISAFMTTSRRTLVRCNMITDSRELRFFSRDASTLALDAKNQQQQQQQQQQIQLYQPGIQLTAGEQELFELLTQVTKETNISSTLRVAGGWVRDKLLATPQFHRSHTAISMYGSNSSVDNDSTNNANVQRLTSKFMIKQRPMQRSMGRQGTKVIGWNGASTTDPLGIKNSYQQPVDIDIALDDMLGREFADHLNDFLTQHGKEKVSVGVVLKNPEKSKHLETATMKVGQFWIDFVNLRAEQYTQDSRIPDLMRIGSPAEDAQRRDLTINALFYNINTGEVEDWTGRGFGDLKRGIVATPLAPLTTLLDDPLRVLRSVRFAARLRFSMDDALVAAAQDKRVRRALAQKVSRERVGGEVDLMLRSPDPVGAMRLLMKLNVIDTVFPIQGLLPDADSSIFTKAVNFLSTAHDHLCDCRINPPLWCNSKKVFNAATYGVSDQLLMQDEETRRLLWYASFLKPLWDQAKTLDAAKVSRRQNKKANRSILSRVLVDGLKRPIRDAEAIERIIKVSDDFTALLKGGCDLSSIAVLICGIKIEYLEEEKNNGVIKCWMNGESIDTETEEDHVWLYAMEFRLLCSKLLQRAGPLWRAALFLSLSEQLSNLNVEYGYPIPGDMVEEAVEERRRGIIERYDTFAAALLQLGLVGIWEQKPLIDGGEMKTILTSIPKGPIFREIMDEQVDWMIAHPGAGKGPLIKHLTKTFPEYV